MSLTYEDGSYTIQAATGAVPVKFSRGRLSATYRSEYIMAESLAELREKFTKADTEAEEKRARAKAREEARKHPLPGYARNGLQPLQVRGVHAGHGKVLVTLATGAKEMMDPSTVLRDLTEEELAELYRLQAEALRLKEAIPKPPKFKRVVEQMGVTAVVRFDFATDEQVLVLSDGIEMRGTDAVAAYGHYLRQEVAKTYPFFKDGQEVKETASPDALTDYEARVSTYDEMFRTREEGDAYLDAVAARDEAQRTFAKALTEHRFDLDIFKEEE